MNAQRSWLFWVLLISGLLSAANAAWMLWNPQLWYHELPAGVPDTGPYNEHFVRDIGTAFLTLALAFVWAAYSPRWRPPLLAIATFFLVAHAGLHLFDTARGFLDSHHWLLDFPAVYLPALLLPPLAWRVLRDAAPA